MVLLGVHGGTKESKDKSTEDSTKKTTEETTKEFTDVRIGSSTPDKRTSVTITITTTTGRNTTIYTRTIYEDIPFNKHRQTVTVIKTMTTTTRDPKVIYATIKYGVDQNN